MRYHLPAPSLVAALACVMATPAAAELSPAEQRIGVAVEVGQEAHFALLEQLVEINSGTHNHAGVRAVADVLRPRFEALGFTVEWIDQRAAGRAGHLFARHKGTAGSKRMLLIGHLDTVFEPASPFRDYVREGMRATGPGVEDDKGGVVVMLMALAAMQQAGTLAGANITVALTGDEEDVGEPMDLARADLLAAAREAEVALDFEGLGIREGRDMGSIARRSSNSWTLTTSGRQGHSSGIFSAAAGNGAAYELARILEAFRTQLPEADLTYNVGLMAAGSTVALAEDGLSAGTTGKTNVIAPVGVARGDLRTISREQTERVVGKMRAIVEANLPGSDAEIAFDLRYPPMPPTAGNAALLTRLNGVNADLGLAEMPALPPALRGAGDINFVAGLVDGLVGLGAAGEGSHAPGESADLASFARQAKRAAIMMSRLAAER